MPIGHLLAVTLFDGGEVGLAGWVFWHGARVIEIPLFHYLFTYDVLGILLKVT